MPKGVYTRTLDTRRRMSEARKGKSPANKGVPWSAELRAKVMAALKTRRHGGGRPKGLKNSLETRQRMSLAHRRRGTIPPSSLGLKRSLETRRKISMARRGVPRPEIRGSLHYKWRNGATEEKKRIRESLEYRLWRDAVYQRDNYLCQLCGKGGRGLIAHHIKFFSHFPELRTNVDNGQTLCTGCHNMVHTIASHMSPPCFDTSQIKSV